MSNKYYNFIFTGYFGIFRTFMRVFRLFGQIVRKILERVFIQQIVYMNIVHIFAAYCANAFCYTAIISKNAILAFTTCKYFAIINCKEGIKTANGDG